MPSKTIKIACWFTHRHTHIARGGMTSAPAFKFLLCLYLASVKSVRNCRYGQLSLRSQLNLNFSECLERKAVDHSPNATEKNTYLGEVNVICWRWAWNLHSKMSQGKRTFTSQFFMFLCKFSVENALATAPSCLNQAGSPICGAILKLSMKGEQLQVQVVPKKRWVHACNRFIPTSARVRPPLLHFLRQRRPKLAELQTDTLQKSERHSDTITSKPIWIAKFCSSSLCRTQSKLSKTYDIAIGKARDATEAHFHSFTLAKSGIFSTTVTNNVTTDSN